MRSDTGRGVAAINDADKRHGFQGDIVSFLPRPLLTAPPVLNFRVYAVIKRNPVADLCQNCIYDCTTSHGTCDSFRKKKKKVEFFATRRTARKRGNVPTGRYFRLTLFLRRERRNMCRGTKNVSWSIYARSPVGLVISENA